MRQCLFCPNPADSREHVLPQWLFRCVAPAENGSMEVHVGRYVEGQGYLDRRDHVSLAFKARIVCGECNGGWMSQLESSCSKSLRHLVDRRFPILVNEFLAELRAQSALLALWLSKTAVTTSFALPGRLRLPESFVRQVSLRQVPHGVWLDVAKARVPGIGAALSKGFHTVNGGHYAGMQSRVSGDSFQFCLQVNHLLLRVAMCPEAEVHYRPTDGSLPVRLFPKPKPIPESFEYPGLNHFLHSVVLRTWPGCRGEVPRSTGEALGSNMHI